LGKYVIILLTAVLLAACGPTITGVPPSAPTLTTRPSASLTVMPESGKLIVFAAASLTDAFTEIGQNFKAAHPGIMVTFNYAGSQTLSTQLVQGAVADVFASANHLEMDKVVTADLISQNAPQDFLTNRLLVILPKNNPAHVQTLHDLARPGLKLILADSTVPAGKYARQVLNNISKDPVYGSDFLAEVLSNLVSNEIDIKQVVAKIQLGEGDAGIVYISDAVAAPELGTIEIPDNLNVIAKYPIAALTNAPQPTLAAEFIAYVLSTEGQAVLQKWGFTPIVP
jgi:molybdate transport system substrate-binding protein